jgi:hypothetical protein
MDLANSTARLTLDLAYSTQRAMVSFGFRPRACLQLFVSFFPSCGTKNQAQSGEPPCALGAHGGAPLGGGTRAGGGGVDDHRLITAHLCHTHEFSETATAALTHLTLLAFLFTLCPLGDGGRSLHHSDGL